MDEKQCKICGEFKSAEEFYKEKLLPGGMRLKCKSCIKLERRKYYLENKSILNVKKMEYRLKNKNLISDKDRKYYNKNKHIIKARVNDYRSKNRDLINYKKREYFNANRDIVNAKTREYRKKNKDILNMVQKRRYYMDLEKSRKRHNVYNKKYIAKNRKKISENFKIRVRSDKKFRLKMLMASAVRKSLKGNKRGRRWENLTGYTVDTLMKHLKKTIPPGYSWKDFLDGTLHIDHKIPVSVFNFKSPKDLDFKRCWSLNNLQLLEAIDNIKKGNKLQKPFQPSLYGI